MSLPTKSGHRTSGLQGRLSRPQERNPTQLGRRLVWETGLTCEQGRPKEPTVICVNGLHWSTVPAATMPFMNTRHFNGDMSSDFVLSCHEASVPSGVLVFAHDFDVDGAQVSDKDPIAHKRVSSKLTLGAPLTGIFIAPGHYKLLSFHDGRLDSKHSLADLRRQHPSLFSNPGKPVNDDDEDQWIVPSMLRTFGEWSHPSWFVEGVPLVELTQQRRCDLLFAGDGIIPQSVNQWPDRVRTIDIAPPGSKSVMKMTVMHRDNLPLRNASWTPLRRRTIRYSHSFNIHIDPFLKVLRHAAPNLLLEGAMTEPFLRTLFNAMTVPSGSLRAELTFSLLCQLALKDTHPLTDLEVLMMLYPELIRHDPSGALFRLFLKRCRHCGSVPAYRWLERLSDGDLVTVLETTDRKKNMTIVQRIVTSRTAQKATGTLPFLERYFKTKKSQQ